jgi:uncharacterized protein (DUF1501 family)
MTSFHESILSRREVLKLSAAGALSLSASGWLPTLARQAAAQTAQGRKRKACILLWMDGGPSHVDTFDPKPDASAEVHGDLKTIATSVSGIQVSERFPKLAQQMQHAAILRGMSTEEADHGRARIYMHTGYKPGLGGVNYPGLGSIVSAEVGRPESPLPNFVVTGTPLNKYEFFTSPGYLGPRHEPLALADPNKGLENLKPLAPADDFNDRVAVLEQLEQFFARTYQTGAPAAHQTTLGRAVQLIRSDKGKAFDLALESAEARAAYGDSDFGRGCLLARRLVEAGVAFVEVYLSNWDTHEKRVADTARDLMTQVDLGMSALISDLHQRGLLDSTLVVWMGEFGRTPRINRNGGRDHWARSWSTLLAGGGIKGGQVIGKTDREAASVVERPVSVRDFMATVCRVLDIDYTRKNMTPIGRPITFVDAGANPIQELLG